MLEIVTTTAGRQAILNAVAGGGNVEVVDVQLSDTDQTADQSTTALGSVVATVSAVGSVRAAGQGYALHVVMIDDSAAAYDVRALALRLTGGVYLMVYSQAVLIAQKSSGSSLHLALDLTIDADTAATITFGDTDYALPMAGDSSPGIIELATESEVRDGTDAVRAVTPQQLSAVYSRIAGLAQAAFGAQTGAKRPEVDSSQSQVEGLCLFVDGGRHVLLADVGGGQQKIYTSDDEGLTWTARHTFADTNEYAFAGLVPGNFAVIAEGSDGFKYSAYPYDTWSEFSGTLFLDNLAGEGAAVALWAGDTALVVTDGTRVLYTYISDIPDDSSDWFSSDFSTMFDTRITSIATDGVSKNVICGRHAGSARVAVAAYPDSATPSDFTATDLDGTIAHDVVFDGEKFIALTSDQATDAFNVYHLVGTEWVKVFETTHAAADKPITLIADPETGFVMAYAALGSVWASYRGDNFVMAVSDSENEAIAGAIGASAPSSRYAYDRTRRRAYGFSQDTITRLMPFG